MKLGQLFKTLWRGKLAPHKERSLNQIFGLDEIIDSEIAKRLVDDRRRMRVAGWSETAIEDLTDQKIGVYTRSRSSSPDADEEGDGYYSD